MDYTRLLLGIKGERLEVSMGYDGDIHVCFYAGYVKGDGILSGEYGSGSTYEEALNNYVEKIRGKVLVFNPDSKNRYEVLILC